MIPVSGYEGRQMAVFGLGASGIATAKALIAGEAFPLCWDDAKSARNAAESAGLAVSDLNVADWSAFAGLVLSPGIPFTDPAPHPIVELATAANVPIIGDLELFSRERERRAPQSPLVAVTGTNGKSTTVALIAYLLSAAGHQVELGGNFGPAALSLRPPATGRTHVLECSSYQIELAPSLRPSVGVLLNLSPDHVDRHGSFERYVEIKGRVPAAAKRAVICVDDPRSALIADHIEQDGGRVIRVSIRNPVADGVCVSNGIISEVAGAAERPIADISEIGTLRGEHNAQNAAAAVATALSLDVNPNEIAAALVGFLGLPHRMEEVGLIGRVLFINDSKATNAEATAHALASFNDIHWIVGGRPKSGGITGLEPLFPRVAKAFLIGESAPEFARVMEGRLTYDLSETLERAVADAIGVAVESSSPEPVVLLSPAAASFDQFKDYAERGDAFRDLFKKQKAKGGKTAG